ncbi:DUF1573 domain-containing protein [Allorhodopirellula solitaria]|uniref:DUF1573 domain-containing protein n=1 Tax=Allorhodopirellula solitaria TaxID=2527987 RepID=A0A5C5WQ55_9BACT|nr:DUF1573 domain-containing protein [Allorhodopirellula solitaria]TWT52163.1 hypothetical protein CA85_50780 [Allorhodopirellula solitaria]
MKIFIACLVFAAIGVAVALTINEGRYGHYEPTFGPISYRGDVDASNAMATLEEGWSETFAKIELPDGNSHDFGVMRPDEKGEHQFVVKNVGDAPLVLKVGASTCKCTVGELGDEMLEPGEQTEVTMSWTVTTNKNTFGQSAELRTNDPAQVAIRFEITGSVVRDVRLFPEEITFGEVAAGDDIDLDVSVFTFMDHPVTAGEVKFSDETINEFADFEVEPFEPSEQDGVNEAADQGFRVHATLHPGLKQGPVTSNLVLTLLPQEDNADNGDSEGDEASAENDGAPDKLTVYIPVNGRIVGAMSLLPNSRLRGVSGGGYVFDFGILGKDDPLTAKVFVRLKGDSQSSTKLSLGEVSPAEHVQATLGEPVGKGSMTLSPLEIKLKPGATAIDRMGMNRGDYGFIMIESDDPKTPALKLMLKFALPAQ